jgi:hypothetical protein
LGNTCYHSSESSVFLIPQSKVKIIKQQAMILPFTLYGCENWCLKLGQKHRFRVSKSRVLRRPFRKKMDEVTGVWRKLLNDEFHNS